MDLKKSIIGFLILSTGTSASALILSNINLAAPVAAPSPEIVAIGSPSASALGGNVFLPSIIDPNVPVAPIANATSADPNNITDILSDAFLNSVVSANPNGPRIDSTGNPTISQPDAQSIALAAISSTAVRGMKIPDWDLEADSQPIKTGADSSLAGITAYSNSLSVIMTKHLVATNLESIVNNPNPDSSQAAFVRSKIQNALEDTLALATPPSLLPLQKSLVKLMVYEKNVLGLLQTANTDPMKAALVLQGQEVKYNSAIKEVQAQIQKSTDIKGFSFGHSDRRAHSSVPPLGILLGVQTANAQWLTFDSANFGQWIYSFAKNVALQILKNTLMALIQRKVLTWVQGKGVPRFIQSWGTTLVNAYTQTALSAINSQMNCVYPLYTSQLKLTLGAFYKPGGSNSCANTFQAALAGNSLPQFWQNFENGGWGAYGASLLPSGNYYGGLFFTAQTVANSAQIAQDAAKAKATANQGQKGDEVCTDGSNPNGTYWVCQNPDGSDYLISEGESGLCSADGGIPVLYGNNGQCADGSEPKVTTPGLFTGFGVNSAIDASPKLVAAANDIVGILNAVLSSLMNSLANLAINAAGSGVNSGLSGGGSGITSLDSTGIQGGGTNTAQTVALACNPPIQTVSSTAPASIGAIGGTLDANGNLPTYTWTTTGGTGTGYIFSPTFTVPGTYVVTLTDSAGDPSATCQVIVE